MAINPNDKTENQGLRGAVNKNFGPDEKGRGFLGNVTKGAINGTFLGMPPKEGAFSAFGALMAVSLLSSLVADRFEHNTDIQLSSAEITQNVDEFTAYQYDGTRYLLQNTDEGARLFVQSSDESSEADDLYVLVSNERAEEVAREMARMYLTEIGFDDPDLALLLEEVSNTDTGPVTFNYENLSVTFQQGEDGRIYIVGDNIDENSAQAWDATDGSLQEGFDNWRSAMEHFAYSRTIQGDEQTPDADYYKQLDDKDLSFFLYALGLLAAGGGAAAGGQSIISSRRRHKQKNHPRP
jgi:hypothetical protein